MGGAVEPHEQRLALDVGEAHVQVAGQAVDRVPVQEDLVELREEPLAEPLAQPEDALRLVRHALAA